MTRKTQHDRTPPEGADQDRQRGQRGVAATAFGVLRRHRGALAGATGRVVGLAGLVGLLLTAAIFALSWPLFTHMHNQVFWYRHAEDPYLHDHTDLALVALWTLPLFLLLLGIGSAALQSVFSRAVAAGTPAPTEGDRLRPVLAVYALRGLIVWPLPVLVALVADSFTGLHIDTEDQILERGSWAYTLVEASPLVAVLVAVLLRLGLALAPAAAAAGAGPREALRRSWSLVWTRAGAVRVLALALPLAALSAGVLRLVVQVALPLRPAVRDVLEQATGNFFAAYYAGILAPVIVGILVTAALALPVSCTAFAVLHERLPGRTEQGARPASSASGR